ncbi:conserved hypothetical protein [Altererythrobacter sp. B11]|uniref:GH12 family glycosyl hydrolase domain-containing protein n=1 Tax=Altererythrobacter sp. B11 TaxID=2060312 RepID=UPI000DC71880|nr:hypothetical protein [Altererythrobacter sp. B11]BBC70957.1 conserved hypothetical protein [Altererythrobacter sp. B11]
MLIGAPGAWLSGGKGHDTYNVWSADVRILERAGEGVDTFNARFWGAVTLPDNVENLVLFTKGNTLGVGNALANTITASPYGSTLNGMAGNDTLIGGAGSDIFEFGKGSGRDTVVNFQQGWDSIRLKDFGVHSFEELLTHGRQVGADVQFYLGGDTLVLQNTALFKLQATDFEFRLPAPQATEGYLEMDGAGRAFNAHGWYVHNNAWGSGQLVEGVDYTLDSVYSRDDMTSGTEFTWSYPYGTKSAYNILAYPEVSFGVNPKAAVGHKGNPTDTAAVFPVQVDDIASLKIDFDVSFSGTVSGFNVSYDIWLTDKPFGGRESITNELMVWLHTGDFPPVGKVVGTYTQDGQTASIYHEGTYTAVVFDKDWPSGQLDMVALLGTLEKLGIVSSDEYLASINLGAEVVFGNGSLTVNNLDFTLETRGDDGTIIRKEVTGAGTTVTEIPPEPAVHVEDIVTAGALVGFKSTTHDGDLSKTEWCNTDGKLVKSEVAKCHGEMTETQFFDANGKFTGADQFTEKADGKTSLQHFDQNWTFLGAENTVVLASGQTSIRSYDSGWHFTGARNVVDKGDGASSIRYYDAKWQFTGSDEISVKDGVTSTRHFDANAKFTGADNLSVRDDGSVWNLHYDKDWKFAGAEVSRPAADGVVVTTEYDSHWTALERTHDGTIGDDIISAGWGSNLLRGGFGSDILIGGGGKDMFVFDTTIGNDDVDILRGFKHGTDKIALDSHIFDDVDVGGHFALSAFAAGPTAVDADDRIIYDRASGNLYYDPDGNGAAEAVQFAHLDNRPVLTAQDFILMV